MAVRSLKNSSLLSSPADGNSMLAGYSFQDFHHLETVQLGGNAASVTFTNLLQYSGEFKHLQIRAVVSHTGSGGNALGMRLNDDSGGSYSYHELVGDGTSTPSSGSGNQTSVLGVALIRQNLGNTSFGAGVVDILDAFQVNKNKTIKAFSGHASSPNSIVGLSSGARLNTEAVSSISLFMSVNDIGANSRLSLYGIR